MKTFFTCFSRLLFCFSQRLIIILDFQCVSSGNDFFFLWSGSVLVSCSHFGAHVMGSDIDHTLLHGRGTQTKSEFLFDCCCCFFFYTGYNAHNMYFYNDTTSTPIF